MQSHAVEISSSCLDGSTLQNFHHHHIHTRPCTSHLRMPARVESVRLQFKSSVASRARRAGRQENEIGHGGWVDSSVLRACWPQLHSTRSGPIARLYRRRVQHDAHRRAECLWGQIVLELCSDDAAVSCCPVWLVCVAGKTLDADIQLCCTLCTDAIRTMWAPKVKTKD